MRRGFLAKLDMFQCISDVKSPIIVFLIFGAFMVLNRANFWKNTPNLPDFGP